ncbi:MAG: DinB family protein [bacterium]
MTAEELFVDVALRAWKTNIDRFEGFYRDLPEEQLEQEIAPGRNRLIYLLGHMAAVHDRMIPLLGIGSRLHPELDEVFISSPDRSVASSLSAAALKEILVEVDGALWKAFAQWSPADWLARHTAVSEEEFVREPHRNRFSVLLSRTTHMASHQGQVILATPRA